MFIQNYGQIGATLGQKAVTGAMLVTVFVAELYHVYLELCHVMFIQ